jgi:hypothetical protein
MKLAAIGTILLLFLWALSPTFAQTKTFVQTKQMALPAADIHELRVHCGAGSLYIINAEWQDTIRVIAEIEVDNLNQRDEQGFADKNAVLSLDRKGKRAILNSDFKRTFRPPVDARINLTIEVPKEIDIHIDDGSGPITVERVVGSVRVADGSGKIIMEDIQGNVEVKDGSGSIEINKIRGDVRVTDGSGIISVQYVDGNVTVADESGRIDINDITGNVLIREPGTGELNVERIKGKVVIQN